ncbi:MAG TPA: hypothetical protein VHZ07_12650 [Bryobacteraceae bacterium]|jgi:hypothetical protein|nr:hypothetical protein [Bryobacteraceae bacterium]
MTVFYNTRPYASDIVEQGSLDAMNKRPLAVIVIGWLYVATGVMALAFHLIGFKPQHPFQYDIVWMALVNLTAIVCGAYLLRGRNWARWVALAWIGFHVALSIFHPPLELLVHSLLCIAVLYFLFRPQATQYFRTARA